MQIDNSSTGKELMDMLKTQKLDWSEIEDQIAAIGIFAKEAGLGETIGEKANVQLYAMSAKGLMTLLYLLSQMSNVLEQTEATQLTAALIDNIIPTIMTMAETSMVLDKHPEIKAKADAFKSEALDKAVRREGAKWS